MSTQQDTEDVPLTQRVAENPRPALVWVAMGVVIIGVEFGAVLQVLVTLAGVVVNLIPGDLGVATVAGLEKTVNGVPTLLSRELIPNRGYWNGQQWVDTFLGLSPAVSWATRATLVYAYAFAFLLWLWNGYTRFRRHYREADWTPRDDIVDRLRNHHWGQFGFVVVFLFVVMAVFAPTLGPTTADANILRPYSHEVQYWSEDTGTVETVTVGTANLQSGSQGDPARNVGPMTYDDFDRWHPFGTTTNGKDMFTEMALGARVSLSIGVVSMTLAGIAALAFGMLTAYYKGLIDLLVVITSDSVQSLPLVMVLILMVVVFEGTWLAEVYDGALLLIVILSAIYWPYLWRSIRGPAFQISEEEWIDAAKSFGQRPRVIMKRHMAPYVVSYMLIYASLSLGGIIISVAGLSFLGLGITAPTPEWGRIIADGRNYVATASWHISLIPGLLITLVVTGFNAMGDGIRDAIDPQSESGDAGTEAAAAGGGGA